MRDPKILIGMIVLPLIMFPVLGLVMGYAVQTAQTEAQRATLLVVDNDWWQLEQCFRTLLKQHHECSNHQ